jgi:thymidylate kinase
MTERFPRLKHIVINIRGTNASGKTTLAKSLLESFSNTPLINPGNGKVLAYVLGTGPTKTALLGPYRITTGGYDAIDESYYRGSTRADYASKAITDLSRRGNVVFEGALAATLTQRWIDLARSLPHTHWIFGFMDTPLEKCLQRMVKRRIQRKDPRPVDPDKSLYPKYKAVLGSEKRLREVGADVRVIPYQDGLQTILAWLWGWFLGY